MAKASVSKPILARIPAGAGGIDIEVNRLLGIVELQIQQLGNDQFRDIDAHLALGIVIGKQGQAQINDPLLEQQ